MKNNNQRLKSQSGVALITVLLILAVMVVVATNMTSRLQLELRRTQAQVLSQQAYWYGAAAESFAALTIRNALKDDDVVSLGQNWATKDMTFPLEGGEISGEILDRQACFNLNALGVANKPDGQRPLVAQQFQALLEAIGVEGFYAEKITDSVRDWVDENDQVVTSQGAEDAFYESRSVPYLAANTLMTDISEFRAVQGVTQGVFDKLSPYLCALPSKDLKINVNTIEPEQSALFQGLFTPFLTAAQASELLKDRPGNGWDKIEEFWQSPVLAGLKISEDAKKQMDVKSEYFQLQGRAKFEDTSIGLKTLFKASKKEVVAIRRQYGGVQ